MIILRTMANMVNDNRRERAASLRIEAARERRCMGVDSERRAADLEQQAAELLRQCAADESIVVARVNTTPLMAR